MKHQTLIGRLTGKFSIPAFAGIMGALLSVVLFAAVVSVSVFYRMVVQGEPFDGFIVPPLVMFTMFAACVLVSAGGAYLTAKPLHDIFVRFTAYMLTNRIDAEAELESLQFPELRRLRVASTRAVRKLRRENETLRNIAYKDSRTGLPNVIALERHVNATLPEASFEYPAAFLLLDIDRFGQLLEQVGTQNGDALIDAAATRLTRALSDLGDPAAIALRGSMLSALSADKFALYLPCAINRDHVISIARAVRAAFAEPFDLPTRQITMSISGGIVIAPEDAEAKAFYALALIGQKLGD